MALSSPTTTSTSPATPEDFVKLVLPTDGPIGDAFCNIEDLERANDSQLHTILTELRLTNFFKNFEVDLDHTCPLDASSSSSSKDASTGSNGSTDHSQELQQQQQDEFECSGGFSEELGLDEEAEPLCTVQDDSDPLENNHNPFLQTMSSNVDLDSYVLESLSKGGFSSQDHRKAFQWQQQTDIVVEDDDSEAPCNAEESEKYLPDSFWMDMCSNIKKGVGTKFVNLALNPERNTGYNGTHIWKAIYEENCLSQQEEMCLEERVLYRLLSGLHTSTTLSIAKYYYPPSKKKGRTDWEPNTAYFMDKFQHNPEYLRNLHFSYLVMLRALRKASNVLYNYEIHSGNLLEDETSEILLRRLLDSAILRSCSAVFSAFDESLMFQESSGISPGDKHDIDSLRQNFKGVFHNISSILDCVQCQQCKLHGKMTMLGYGTALKILLLPSNLLTSTTLERNEVVALINTAAKLSESMREARHLTTLYWEQQQQPKQSGTALPSPAPIQSKVDSAVETINSFDLLDTTVAIVSTLGKENLISAEREEELIELALARQPDLLVLSKHYKNDLERFLKLSKSIGTRGGETINSPIPDAIVVGSGLAGLAAALNILDRGGTVTIIEKEHLLGGNSNKASSGINACCPHNNTYGDSITLFRNDTVRSAGEVANLELINTLVENSEKAVTWLKDRVGVDLSLLAQLGGHSSKRTHRPNNGMAGSEIIYHIQKAVRSYQETGKVTILVDTKVTSLLTDDESGRVVGVRSEKTTDGSSQELKADNVILATGGFAADRSSGSYLDQYRPELMRMPATAGAFSTGDGITLATALGAGTRDMDKVQLHPTGWVDPADPKNPNKILAAELMRGIGGLLINNEGKRFCNELGTRAYVTDKILSHNDNYEKTKEWDVEAEVPVINLVLSSAAAEDGRKHVDLYTHKGLLTRIEGVKALAKWMGVSKSNLTSTLQSYQRAASKGKDEFGKASFRGLPAKDLEKEVFYAGKITPVLHYCMGGIKIDKEGNVLKEEDGSIIPGLHAAGEVTGGVHGNNRLGGNSLLECTVYGTIVGQKIPVKEESNSSRTVGVMHEESKEEEKPKDLPKITAEELSKHSSREDLWVAINGIVYDFTDFADEHPAGPKSIYKLAGTDGTAAFSAVHNENMLDNFLEEKMGTLVVNK